MLTLPLLETPPLYTKSIADNLVQALLQAGIDHVFGVPGGAIEPFFDALARQLRLNAPEQENTNYLMKRRVARQQNISLIIARHEAGAAFMADGYARETGRLAVCCATTGPGTTNLITGVASAYADRVPMLVITAQTALPNHGRRGLQESSSDAIDTVAMLAHCTKYSSLVSHPEQLSQKIAIALIRAYQAPRGPVHLSIPIDVLRSELSTSKSVMSVAPMLRAPKVVDAQGIEALYQCVSRGEKMAILLGSEAGEDIEPIIRFAEQTASPIVTTPMGKRWISGFHPLNYGVFGFAGHESSLAILNEPELRYVLAVGTSLGELGTGGWSETSLLNDKLIHIDANMENFTRSTMACLHVYGNIALIFKSLLDRLDHNTRDIKRFKSNIDRYPNMQSVNASMQDEQACHSDSVPLKPQQIMHFLSHRFPDETRVVCDAGNSWAWATHYLHLHQARRYHIGMGYGSMAWAIGASIGVALACQGSPVICLTGDGSFLMSSQELTVAVQLKLPVIFIVLNDQALGMVKHGQRLGGGEQIGFQLPEVNFAAMAETMGAPGFRIKSQEELASLDIASLCQRKGPSLLDIHIDPEQVPPIGNRMKVLKNK